MLAVPFPRSSTPNIRVGDGQGRIINAQYQKNGDVDLYIRVPGLSETGIDTGKTGPRGSLLVNDVLYAVFSDADVTIGADGGVVTLANVIPGTDGVTLARNNRTTGSQSTPDIVVVREKGGAFVVNSTTGVTYQDPDLPGTVNSVSYIGGFFMFTLPDGRMFASDLNSLDINPLSFATAEARADGLLRGVVHSDRFYAMGSSTIEPWQNLGDSPFPLRRAASIIPVGLLTTMAVAGDQEGWDGPLGFVSSDKRFRLLQGFDTQPISTPAVERFIAASTVSTIEVYCYTYDGVPIFGLTSNLGTWEYNLTSGNWHERDSVGTVGWRGTRTVKRAGDWIAFDRLSGKLLKVDPTAKSEAGSSLRWQAESAPFKEYPDRVQVPSYMADFAPAAGSVFTQWSHDGGGTWSDPIERSLAEADRFPVRINRLGLSTHHGLRIRHYIDDPIDVSFMGGSIPKPAKRAP